jgi:hypothetical protein
MNADGPPCLTASSTFRRNFPNRTGKRCSPDPLLCGRGTGNLLSHYARLNGNQARLAARHPQPRRDTQALPRHGPHGRLRPRHPGRTDEPPQTFASRQCLEEALSEYDGAILLISHDGA